MTFSPPVGMGVNGLLAVKTSDYTILATDNGKVIPINTASGPIKITLPAPTYGFYVTLVDATASWRANNIWVSSATPTTQTINNMNPGYLFAGMEHDSVSFISDGSNWLVLNGYKWTQHLGTRGMFIGGVPAATGGVRIQTIQIETLGNATQVARLYTYEIGMPAGLGNRYRGLSCGGQRAAATNSNVIEYFSIASSWNETTFGQLTVGRQYMEGLASDTRGVICGGYIAATSNVMDYVTIASAGNATDFGDLTVARRYAASSGSTTIGIMGGGTGPTNVIDYITIATKSNATDFGDLTQARYGTSGCSSATRSLFCGGFTTGAVNTIDYVTIASIGNASDFGDISFASYYSFSVSSLIRGVVAGGAGTGTNVIEYVTIASVGNSADFGDLVESTYNLCGFSNGHGGLA